MGVCPKGIFVKKVTKCGLLNSEAIRSRFSSAVISTRQTDDSINNSFVVSKINTATIPPMPPNKSFDKTIT